MSAKITLRKRFCCVAGVPGGLAIHTHVLALGWKSPPAQASGGVQVSTSSSLECHGPAAGVRVEEPVGQGLVLATAPALCPSQGVSGALQGACWRAPGLLQEGVDGFLEQSAVLCTRCLMHHTVLHLEHPLNVTPPSLCNAHPLRAAPWGWPPTSPVSVVPPPPRLMSVLLFKGEAQCHNKVYSFPYIVTCAFWITCLWQVIFGCLSIQNSQVDLGPENAVSQIPHKVSLFCQFPQQRPVWGCQAGGVC